MIAEALKFLASIQTPQRDVFSYIDDQPYRVNVDGTLGEPIREVPSLRPPAFQVATLKGLVDLYIAELDDLAEEDARAGVHIVDPLKVRIVSLGADEHGRRHVFAEAAHVNESGFVFNTWHEPEQFLLLRAGFYWNEETAKVQQLCSVITSGTEVGVADDGVSQQVTVKSGTITRSTIELNPEGIPLIPWRTFREAAPVESKFLLRMKGVKDQLPKIALFEIDAKWKLDTVASIRHYLQKELPKDALIIG